MFTSITGNGDMGITGMQSGAVRGRRRWIVNPVQTTLMKRYLNNYYCVYASVGTQR